MMREHSEQSGLFAALDCLAALAMTDFIAYCGGEAESPTRKIKK
jgi:hypothetical protein